MTFQSLIPVAPDGAHAGDLVGYDKRGRPLYLPGGGARDGQIVTTTDDDDADDGADDDDADDDDGPAPAPVKSTRPTYKALLEQVATLSAQVDPEQRRKLNAELRRNREVRQLLEKNSVSTADLAAWLATRNATPAAAAAPEPAAAVTPPEVTGGQTTPAEPAKDDKPVVDQAAIDRLVEEGIQARLDQEGGRADMLLDVLRVTSVEAELKAIGFSGTLEKALRVLDLDGVDIDDEGKVTGAVEVAASLKEEIPEWFATRRNGATPPEPRVTDGNDVDGAARPGRRPKTPGWDQQIIQRLTG